MAIYYKFKSARDYDTIPMDGPFISVGILKEKIYETKHLGSGKDLDIVISNAQTNEEYLDEAMLIPKNTSVLIRRVPGRPRIRVITIPEPRVENKVENVQADTNNIVTADITAAEDEFDEFGTDLYSIPDAPSIHSSHDPAPADDKVDEETKIKALIDTPALDWQQPAADGYGPGRGYGRGMVGRMGGRGFGMERKTTPPPGYTCHRCNVPGHFIQHCPTNGDPSYDVKRVKPPTGIPKSMLMATPDGSYSLPSGAVAVLKPNEDAFEKEMEGLTSTTRSVGEFPPELKCPLCKEVMRHAALTSKCCFKSYCDKCIRDHIITKSKCVCGATDVLADDLLPNKTLRDTINRMLESGNSSAENAGSMCQVQDMESARCPPPKVLSPTTSVASGDKMKPAPSNNNETSTLKPSVEIAEITSAPRETTEVVKVEKPDDASENTQGSLNGKEAAVPQLNTQAPKEEIPQQVASGEQGKRKKKKPRVPGTDMQWNPMSNPAGPDYMMPKGPGPGNQYFNGVQLGFNGVQPGFNGIHHGFNGFPGPFPGSMPPFVGYGLGPMDLSFGNMMHSDPFAAQGFGFPNLPPPHRDLAEMGNRMNLQRPIMGREEFEAKKAEMKRKRENERRSEGGNVYREGEKNRMMNNNSAASSSPMKPKTKQGPRPPISPDYDRRRRSEKLSPERHSSRRHKSPSRSSSRRSERDHHHDRHQDMNSEHDRRRDRHRETDRKHRKRSENQSSEPTAAEIDDDNKSSVFARISFLEEESSSKHRKTSSKSSPAASPPESSVVAAVSSGRRHSRRERESAEHDSSDDEDRHFKRKPSRYKRSPSVAFSDAGGDEHFRHSKRSKGERSRA
ncbi:PREDICTED: E3 ubiquitin-protein ligase RBBP6-like isoform X2 [Camelina sativa]|uniref:E3 ubiquitin-protein ligase RBBP6-like isoform X2 n=1 Tax=Camelina sativa TaxID=90675 RepID=A0ABM0UEK5_CAMSA|nr:PREDICTED: E3 ubiquitin-protein ligase RBBP6-like isoform X2 [Camelina sativa]